MQDKRKFYANQVVFPSDIIFIITLIVIGVTVAFSGVASPQCNYQTDVFFFLANAYRVCEGQVPHRDFSSAWGPVMFLIDAAGLKLAAMSPKGIGYANALFGGLISAWAFVIVRLRWSVLGACALGIYTLLLIVAPFPLGTPILSFSVAMTYNRYGYALFGIILVECAADTLVCDGKRQSSIGAVSTGIAAGLLAFLKVSYALVSLAVIAILLIAGKPDRLRRLLLLCGGFAITAIPLLCYLRFDITDMLQDLAMAARARQSSLNWLKLLHMQVVMENLPLLLLMGAACRYKTGIFYGRAERFHGLLITLLTVLSGLCLLLSNQQESAFPLNAYAAAVFAIALCRSAEAKAPVQALGLVPFFFAGFCLLPLGIESSLSLYDAAHERQWPSRAHVMPVESSWGADLSFAPFVSKWKTEVDGVEYITALNEGLSLLKRHSGPDEGVLTFDMFNPFNYLLHRPSPTGGFAAAAYNYIFSDAAHPDAARFFGNTPYVLVHKYKEPAEDRMAEGNDVAGLMQIYGQPLKADFIPVEETEHWVLWQRKRRF